MRAPNLVQRGPASFTPRLSLCCRIVVYGVNFRRTVIVYGVDAAQKQRSEASGRGKATHDPCDSHVAQPKSAVSGPRMHLSHSSTLHVVVPPSYCCLGLRFCINGSHPHSHSRSKTQTSSISTCRKSSDTLALYILAVLRTETPAKIHEEKRDSARNADPPRSSSGAIGNNLPL
jgi:hypothetical protein